MTPLLLGKVISRAMGTIDSKASLLVCSVAVLTLAGCGSSSNSGGEPSSSAALTSLSSSSPSSAAASSEAVATSDWEAQLPVTITSQKTFDMRYDVTGSMRKVVAVELSIPDGYASLSLYQGDTLLIDSVDIASNSQKTLNVLVEFDEAGEQDLRWMSRDGDVTVKSITFSDMSEVTLPSFVDNSSDIGLKTEKTFKYGGPSVGDLNDDGYFDFVLNNHNFVPTQVVMNQGDNTMEIERLFDTNPDLHGSAIGDYDNDGDLDIALAWGGANGNSHSIYSLFRNDDGKFNDVAAESGLVTSARGRAPRWVDLDRDGDLDLVQINATPTGEVKGPIQLFYRNDGEGNFSQVNVPNLGSAKGERVLITDFNGDGIDDLILYSPLSLWQGNGDFTFTDKTTEWLPAGFNSQNEILAMADVDINNDGLYDIYLARGKTLFSLSNRSIDFNPLTHVIDVRDSGGKGTTLIDFAGDDTLTLSNLDLTFRKVDRGNYPIFLGAAKTPNTVKATGFQPSQLPPEMRNAPSSLDIAKEDAMGWPTDRSTNGVYIGYENGRWQAEWVRDDDLYWNVSLRLTGITDIDFDWAPTNRNVQDVLLINKGDGFEDGSDSWGLPKGGNHWGVTHGDFNNDGFNDLLVNRYGFLKERVTDLLLLNNGKGSFNTITRHGAHDPNDLGHGDMGQAFDFDKDGLVDWLTGSEDLGMWYMYKNTTENAGNYVLVDVSYSPLNKLDTNGAEITVVTADGQERKKRVGSAGEVFSQSLIDTVHFGLGEQTEIKMIKVRWRNGETVYFNDVDVNKLYETKDAVRPLPQAVMLSAKTTKVRPNETLTLSALLKPLNANSALEWAASDTNIATVDQNGLVTGKSIGDVTVTATSKVAPTIMDSIILAVGDFAEIFVSNIEITGGDQAFYVNRDTNLQAVIQPDDADNKTLVWASSDTAVATVSPEGVVSGIAVGDATISAQAEGVDDGVSVSESVDITVEEFITASIVFDDEGKYLSAEYLNNGVISVTASYHAGSEQTVTDAGIKFFLREMNSDWSQVIKDRTLVEATSAGKQSGTVTIEIPLDGATPTGELMGGNFYYLFMEFTSTDGKRYNKGVNPIQIVNP